MKSHYIQTLKLGIPIAVGQIGVIILSFADTMMVGHYNTPSLAAASFVNSFFNLITFLIMGYSYGLTPLISSLYGQQKLQEAGATLKNALVANCIYGGLLVGIMGVLYFFLDRMGQPTELLPLIRPYYLIILFSMLFVIIFNTLRQFTDGTTDTKAGMWILVSGNLLNILGNWLLIFGVGPFPEWGLLGAGASTLISRIYMAVALAGVIMYTKRYAIYRKGYRAQRILFKELKSINAISLPVSLQMGMETFAFTGSAFMAGWLGAIPLAAYQVIITISTLGFLFYYSFAAGMSIRIATFHGTGDWLQLRMAARAGRNILLGLVVVANFVFFFFTEPLVHFFTPDAKVTVAAMSLLVPLMVYQLGDAMQICYANALRGIGNVMAMMGVAGVSYLLIGLPAGYVMGFWFDWGIQGVFLGLPVGLFTASIFFVYLFAKILKKQA